MSKSIPFLAIVGLALLASTNLIAAVSPWQSNENGRVRLIAEYDAAPNQGRMMLGLQFEPAPGWYLYWKDPGEAGIAPAVNWKGTTGLSKPELLWPQPDQIVLPGDIVEYGYEEPLVYPVRAQITGDRDEPIEIHARLTYLTCDTSCIPYTYTFRLTLPKEPTPKIDQESKRLIEQDLARVPASGRSDEEIKKAARRYMKVPGQPIQRDASPEAPPASLPLLLLLAFVGGVILNIMPCVLPVLSIKLTGLLQHSGQAKSAVVKSSLASAAGIVTSFLALAAAAIIARQAGHAVGWGIQFQEPGFVAFLALIVFFFALNLWGVFEINLPNVVGRFATSYGYHESLSAHFVSGLFATLLATPCSAPFLGTAMGFALSQSAGVILAIFGAVGLGMSLPYLVLAVFPRSLRWLPKPGDWMVHLKTALGFLLAATVVWLGYVLGQQITGEGLAWFVLMLVGIAKAAWARELARRKAPGQRTLKSTLLTLVLALLVLGSFQIVTAHRRGAGASPEASGDHHYAWQPFDESAIDGYLKEGRPVFVDVTADWCVTCKYNEKFVLSKAAVVEAFGAKNAVMMQADWTNRDETIGAYLKKHGRAGIPFYAWYVPGQKPVLLSEFLTVGQVLEAIQ